MSKHMNRGGRRTFIERGKSCRETHSGFNRIAGGDQVCRRLLQCREGPGRSGGMQGARPLRAVCVADNSGFNEMVGAEVRGKVGSQGGAVD